MSMLSWTWIPGDRQHCEVNLSGPGQDILILGRIYIELEGELVNPLISALYGNRKIVTGPTQDTWSCWTCQRETCTFEFWPYWVIIVLSSHPTFVVTEVLTRAHHWGIVTQAHHWRIVTQAHHWGNLPVCHFVTKVNSHAFTVDSLWLQCIQSLLSEPVTLRHLVASRTLHVFILLLWPWLVFSLLRAPVTPVQFSLHSQDLIHLPVLISHIRAPLVSVQYYFPHTLLWITLTCVKSLTKPGPCYPLRHS